MNATKSRFVLQKQSHHMLWREIKEINLLLEINIQRGKRPWRLDVVFKYTNTDDTNTLERWGIFITFIKDPNLNVFRERSLGAKEPQTAKLILYHFCLFQTIENDFIFLNMEYLK